MLILLVGAFGLSFAGCTVDADDDDDGEVKIKADTEGDTKSIEIDND
jgi:hypothetical protein